MSAVHSWAVSTPEVLNRIPQNLFQIYMDHRLFNLNAPIGIPIVQRFWNASAKNEDR